MLSPGIPVKDTITVTANATDAETGIRDVLIQYLPAAGSTWTTVCTDTTAPYSCAWNTTTVTDGSYSLRATATDNASHSTASATVDTTVANSLLVVLADPGEIQRGMVNVATTLYNPGTSIYTVRVEYSVAGANNWKTLCASLISPYNCSWNTALFANNYYDLRSVATAGTTSTFSTPVTDILVDNQAPTASMTDPGTTPQRNPDVRRHRRRRRFRNRPGHPAVLPVRHRALDDFLHRNRHPVLLPLRHHHTGGRGLQLPGHRHRRRRLQHHLRRGRQPDHRQHNLLRFHRRPGRLPHRHRAPDRRRELHRRRQLRQNPGRPRRDHHLDHKVHPGGSPLHLPLGHEVRG